MVAPRLRRAWRRDPWVLGLGALAVVLVGLAAVLVGQLVGTLDSSGGSGAVPAPSPPVEHPLLVPPVPVADVAGPTGTIVGHVRDRAGRPVAGISVALLEGPMPTEDFFSYAHSDVTGQSGSYRLEGVPTGRHRVRFVHPEDESRFAPAYNGSAATLRDAPRLWVGQGRTVRADAVLEVGGRLTGVVRSRTGERVPASLVLERRVGGAWLMAVQLGTDQSGRYSVAGLAAGSYRIQVSTSNRGSGYHALPVLATDVEDAEPVQVALGETRRTDVLVPGPGRVVGRVVTPAGAPVPGVAVTVSEDREPIGPTVGTCCISYPHQDLTKTSADGSFAVTPEVLSGSLRLDVSPPPGSPWQACGADLGDAGTFELAAGTVLRREVVLEPEATIIGRVTDADGRPLERVLVRADPPTTSRCRAEPTTRTDPQGRYRLTSLAGQRYRLHFSRGKRYARSYLGGTTTEEGAATVAVRTGGTRTGVDHVLEAPASISGSVRVVGDAEVPSSLCRETSIPPDQIDYDACVTVTGDDTFRFDRVPPGEHHLYVDVAVGSARPRPAYLTADGNLSRDPARSAPLDLAPGEAHDGLEIDLDASATISGVVADRAGSNDEYLDVVLQRLEPDGRWVEVSRTGTNEGATFVFGGLPGGRFRFGFLEFDKLRVPRQGPFDLGLWLASGQQAEGVEVDSRGAG